MFRPPHADELDTSGRRRLILIAAGVGALAALGLVLLISSWTAPDSSREPTPAAASGAPVEQPRRPEPPAAEGSAEALPSAARPVRRRPPRAGEPEAPPEPEATPAYVLRITSDVDGASVFVDRQYLGTAPVETTAIGPGSHQLNASAEGYDGIAQAIEVGEAGVTTVTLKFREVKLETSVAVVHKHAMGSCEGRLHATTAGLRYETPNRNDAFTLPFAAIEEFEVDYLKKNLRVKQRGGRTWNFTEPSGDADLLFVFHRDVSKARARMIELGKSQ